MGHFSITCSLTNLAILPGNRCYFLPLHPVPRPQYQGKDYHSPHGELMIVSNEGACDEYVPYLLPILGEYDSYGRLENIVEDENTKHIEKLFGMKISEFISEQPEFVIPKTAHKVTDSRLVELEGGYGINTELTMSGCFIHEWAWKAAVKNDAEERTEFGSSAWFHPFVTKQMLEFAGFSLVGTQEDRYKWIYRRPDDPKNIRVVTDGDYSHTQVLKGGKFADEYSGHSFASFSETWKKVTKKEMFSESMQKKLIEKSTIDFEIEKKAVLFCELDELYKKIKGDDENEREEAEGIYDLKVMILGMRYNEAFRHIYTMYAPLIAARNPLVFNRISDLVRVVKTFSRVCRMLGPALNGPQDGDRATELFMLNEAYKFVKAHEDEQARYAEEEKREEEEEEKKEAAKKAKKRLNSKSKKSKLS